MSDLQTIIDTLPEVRNLRIPPGEYRLTESIMLPRVHGPCRISGYGVTIVGGDFSSLLRPDTGERDSCTQWTIEGLWFHGGRTAIEIHQTRQLTIRNCRVSAMRRGFDLSFCLLAQVRNCLLGTSELGVRIGYGDSPMAELSNCSTVANTRFYGTGDQLLIDSCSGIVVDQCTFEGRDANRCVAWHGHGSTVTRNLALWNCYWEVAGGPKIAAVWLNNLHAPSVVIDQPEAHPGGAGDDWTFLYGGEHNINATVEIRNPTVLHGKFDLDRSAEQNPTVGGVRNFIMSGMQVNLMEKMVHSNRRRWVTPIRGTFSRSSETRRFWRGKEVNLKAA